MLRAKNKLDLSLHDFISINKIYKLQCGKYICTYGNEGKYLIGYL